MDFLVGEGMSWVFAGGGVEGCRERLEKWEDKFGVGVTGGESISSRLVNVAGRFRFIEPPVGGSVDAPVVEVGCGVEVLDEDTDDADEEAPEEETTGPEVIPIVLCTCPELPTTVSGQSRIIRLTAIPPRLPIDPIRQFLNESVSFSRHAFQTSL